jgi:hypothetical protein
MRQDGDRKHSASGFENRGISHNSVESSNCSRGSMNYYSDLRTGCKSQL